MSKKNKKAWNNAICSAALVASDVELMFSSQPTGTAADNPNLASLLP